MSDRFDEILTELRSDRAEMRREFASWRAHIDRMQDQTDENLRFLREVNRRGEIALQDLLRSQSAMREDIRAETRQLEILIEQTTAHTETIRAHTRSVTALADRLEGGDGSGLAPST